MNSVTAIDALRQQIRAWRQQGLTIALVPTMGNLHEGHLTLVREAQRHADKVVVSVFVNPMQFDRAEDLARYPRTESADAQLLSQVGADLLFLPTVATLYNRPLAEQSYVEVPGIGEVLEGAARPGHFRGVATVVTKLFNLVQPDVACFGEKDFQQLALIRRMVADLSLAIDIIGVPTVRAADGLALSSRNGYLTPDERAIAPRLYQLLQQSAKQLAAQPQRHSELAAELATQLNGAGFRADSIYIVDAETLQPLTDNSKAAVMLVAAFLGKER